MSKEIKNREWREAATGGLILGLAFAAINFLGYYITGEDSALRMLTGLLPFLLIGVLSFSYARKISYLYADQGFTIGQSMGFILKMMLFAGVIAGFGNFLTIMTVDTGQYAEAMKQGLAYMEMAPGEAEKAAQMFSVMIRNPIVMVFSGIISMALYGGLIGLVVSAFVKRAPK